MVRPALSARAFEIALNRFMKRNQLLAVPVALILAAFLTVVTILARLWFHQESLLQREFSRFTNPQC